jgi:DNA-binding CsgD family transcriptional regulator
VSVDEQLVERRSFLASPFLNDFASRANIDRMVNVCLSDSRSGNGAAALSLYRTPGKEAFSAGDVTLLNHLARHLVVAAQNLFHAQSIRVSDALRRQALDAVTAGVFAVNSSGRVVLTNSMGEELIRQARWVCLHNGALLPGENLRESSTFRNALHRAAANGVGSRFIVTDAASNSRALIVAAPVTPTLDIDQWRTGVAALIWATPIVPPEDTARDMALLFVLTGAEQHLLRRLILGDDLRDAATALNVSIHTARAQLKSVFRKTGRRSQAQLLALATRLSTIRKSAGS